MSPIFDHVALRVRNLGASRRFYEAALAPLGLGMLYSGEGGCGFGLESGEGDDDDFWILEGDEPSTGVHIAFVAGDRAAVDSFHSAALGAGGRDNGAPGLRPEYHEGYYGAFVLDPDGNNIEAVRHEQ